MAPKISIFYSYGLSLNPPKFISPNGFAKVYPCQSVPLYDNLMEQLLLISTHYTLQVKRSSLVIIQIVILMHSQCHYFHCHNIVHVGKYGFISGALMFYQCDTQYGSSGAPVFKEVDGILNIVAVHRAECFPTENYDGFNTGTCIDSIIDHVRNGQIGHSKFVYAQQFYPFNTLFFIVPTIQEANECKEQKLKKILEGRLKLAKPIAEEGNFSWIGDPDVRNNTQLVSCSKTFKN